MLGTLTSTLRRELGKLSLREKAAEGRHRRPCSLTLAPDAVAVPSKLPSSLGWEERASPLGASRLWSVPFAFSLALPALLEISFPCMSGVKEAGHRP